MKQCLFCDNKADTREHLWPKWILKNVDIPIMHSIGNSATKEIASPQMTVKCVCSVCNHGWMSQLEDSVKPTIGCMIEDIGMPLDTAQQFAIARWAVKTSMIADVINQRNRTPFYRPEDRVAMRTTCTIPERTQVWIGNFIGRSLLADALDLALDPVSESSKPSYGIANTFLVGHFTVQVFSIRVAPEYDDRPIVIHTRKGVPWSRLLVPIWPPAGRTIRWPPPLRFSFYGPLAIGVLAQRLRIGTCRDVPLF